MKKITLLMAVACLFLACDQKKETKKDIAVVTTEKKVTLSIAAKNQLLATIDQFAECKSKSTTRNECRNAITKMVSEFYKVDDFMDANKNYMIYDSIQPIVKNSREWTRLGYASSQDILDKAQENANNGIPTLAIDVKESFGQVVMIIPGATKASGSWNLKVPNAAALVNYNAKKSFVGKSMSYAFKSAEGILLFSKKIQ